MQRRYLIPSAVVAAAVLVVGSAPGATAKTNKTAKQFSCTIDSVALGQPAPASPTISQLGFVSCPSPFGSGLHYSEITVTQFPAPGAPGAATGTFKNYFSRGTTRGTVALTIIPTNPTNLTYTGTVTYTGGTGRFRHVAGGGTIQCTTTDAGAHKSCDVHTTLTGV
jgi:hypothetical protein